jgi:leader peptidase (prepilin peptidase)/N-methyltransferase
MPHLILILFLFVLGSCIGSFLNVVVWRLPRVEFEETDRWYSILFKSMTALSEPPSHCPRCNKTLKWYDNIPVIGWIKLGGKCRFCKEPISRRYPIVEGITGLLFAGYYIAFFILQIGPCAGITADGRVIHRYLSMTHYWWLYGLDMVLISGLLAASLIDAELFIIPMEIPWLIVPVALAVHAIFDLPYSPGSLIAAPLPAALAAGGVIGLAISMILKALGIFKASFADGAPMLEVQREQHEQIRRQELQNADKDSGRRKKDSEAKVQDQEQDAAREWSSGEVRQEIRREMSFLLPPMALAALAAVLVARFEPLKIAWTHAVNHAWVGGLLGSILGGLVGGFVVWITRILGSIGFGREAMGKGDIDLMVAVGAVLGAGPATVAFFLAPFFGILTAIYLLLAGKRRELPYGPYLSLATAFVMLFYGPIAAYFMPGLASLAMIIGRLFGSGA